MNIRSMYWFIILIVAAFSFLRRRSSLGWGLQGQVARTPHQSKGSGGTVCDYQTLPSTQDRASIPDWEGNAVNTRSMYWRIILIVGVVLVLGLLRVAWEVGPSSQVDVDKAAQIAGCLVPQGEIPVGTNVTVRRLAKESTRLPKSPDRLDFIATGPVAVAIADPANTAKVTLPDKTPLAVAKGKGEFEFQVPVKDGAAVELERVGARLLVVTGQTLRFGPADTAPYSIILEGQTDLETQDAAGRPKLLTLPPGTKGSLLIGDGVYLSALQPLRTMPWLFDIPPNLLPVRATGQKGLSDLTVDARQSGFQFNTAGLAIRACVHDDQNRNWRTAGVVDVKSQEAGAANIRLSLPADVLQFWAFKLIKMELAVASSDGQYVAYGGFTTIGRFVAGLIASGLTLALFGWLLTLRHGQRVSEQKRTEEDWQSWFTGLFIGADNEPSLSLFQIFFWTVITVWALAYVFIVTGTLVSLTAEMLTLLGIAGTGSVLARLIAARTRTPPRAYLSPPGSPPEFWQMLSTTDSSGTPSFDLLKLQLLVFTLVIGVYVVWRITDTATFPALDTNTLLLLGVSQGIYVGGKFGAGVPSSGTSPP